MKQIIALLAFSFCFIASQAQTNLVSQYSKTIDTVINTATKYLTVPAPYGAIYRVTDVAITYTKISGTLAGSVQVQYSQNGTDYYSVQQDSTLTVTDGTSITLGWQLREKGLKYLRVRATGAGTMSGQIRATITPRQQ